MPEGHTVRAIANDWLTLVGEQLSVSSPQGRFADDAKLVDDHSVTAVEAHGKHLFIGFDNDLWAHVHLGRFGGFSWRDADPVALPEVNTVRMRAVYEGGHVDLTGALMCEVITSERKLIIESDLGPDPLRPGDDIDQVTEWISKYKTPIGAVLMYQTVIAGIGNIFRTEILWRLQIDPWKPTKDVSHDQFRAIWNDAITVMSAGVKQGGYYTGTSHIPLPDGTHPEVHGYNSSINKTYVYGREGLPCPRCGEPIICETIGGRKMWRCAICQK